ncbi:fasciclin-1 isoform X1 [Folsomia candida]|uniref:fasciclin-1 isoform X1 n=1 Tax=Folsomia candida TaxID=158441 RepID=UPI000B8FAA3E|nr:fasciclin-1 isoform X1 [Folsomia candida]
MWVTSWVGVVLIALCPIWNICNAEQSLTDILLRFDDLSEFLSLVRGSPFLNASLPWRQGTLFAPTNDAIRKHRHLGGRIDNHTLLYHFANVAKRTSDLEDILSTELPGNPPIWITRNPRSDSDIYLNDAQIDSRRRNFQIKNALGMDQVLHVIDRVLDPTVPDSSDNNLLNPDARKFLEYSSSYNITGNHRITEFARRAAMLHKLDMFKGIGRHTFFIPVDEAFNRIQINTVDIKVIDSHVIPNHVIFLRPSELQPPKRLYDTAAMAPFFPVLVEVEKEDQEDKYIVRSDTRSATDQFHLRGVVQTEVVKGNIPVKNGVVHLINKPLVVIDSTVYQTLAGENVVGTGSNEKENGPTYEFFKLISEYGSEDLKNIIQRPQGNKGITIFVPSNAALLSPTLGELKGKVKELNDIIRLHIVLNTVRSDNITEASERAPFQVETLSPQKQLFFNYQTIDGRRVLYVEGGGVNATITQPDIGATNGVIHMIDRILSYADQNVYSKLQTDPMLQKTFELTSQDYFNRRFNDSKLKFTLFAPSNLAWEKIYRIAPSEYKKLQMGEFGYHVAKIIERHMIVGRAFTIEQLHELSTNASDQAFPIQAVHGILRIESKDDVARKFANDPNHRRGDYYRPEISNPYPYSVLWMNEKSNVVRPNINCTNGIIHIIDTVLMQPDDVTVGYIASRSDAPSIPFYHPLLIISSIIVMFSLMFSRPL